MSGSFLDDIATLKEKVAALERGRTAPLAAQQIHEDHLRTTLDAMAHKRVHETVDPLVERIEALEKWRATFVATTTVGGAIQATAEIPAPMPPPASAPPTNCEVAQRREHPEATPEDAGSTPALATNLPPMPERPIDIDEPWLLRHFMCDSLNLVEERQENLASAEEIRLYALALEAQNKQLRAEVASLRRCDHATYKLVDGLGADTCIKCGWYRRVDGDLWMSPEVLYLRNEVARLSDELQKYKEKA